MRRTYQLKVWNRINSWSRTVTDEKANAELRERIRSAVLTRRGRVRGFEAEARDRAREVCDRLAPLDPITRHAWLFADLWVEESADEVQDENRDLGARDARIDLLRTEAMTEIWSTRGLDGAIGLLAGSDAAWIVGRYAASCAVRQNAVADVLRRCLSTDAATHETVDSFMRGFLAGLDDSTRAGTLSSFTKADIDQTARLFRCAPFEEQTLASARSAARRCA